MKKYINRIEFNSKYEVITFVELIDFAEREVYKSMRKTLNVDSRFILQSELSDEIEIYTILKRLYESVVGWNYSVEDADFYNIDVVDVEIKNPKEARLLCMYVKMLINCINSGYFESIYCDEINDLKEVVRYLESINSKLERIYLLNQ